MGGIGKTRLADEVAARVSQTFDDGIFIIELANTKNSEAAVVSEILARLNINPAGSPDEATAILTTLQNRRTLLVLDNFEAVMSAATFVGRLLKGCPSVHMLVTSQQLLDLSAEQQIEVQPMAAAATVTSITAESLTQFDSFKLFRERARLKKPDWDVTPANAPTVADILDLSDGIPLSIELAASWVNRIALVELRDGLKKSRSQYLKRSGSGIDEKRHASIQACVDWSFNLLKKQEKLLFPKLSAFVGGFFAEDVAEVCQWNNAATLLNSLQEHSLLMWGESLGKTRYRILPTVQEYAAARIQKRKKESDELRQMHAQHYLRILDQANNQIEGKKQLEGLARISAELDNIRTGMDTAVQERHHRLVVHYSGAFSPYLSLKARFPELLMRNEQGLSAAKALKETLHIAGCQNNLGNAYSNLPIGDRAENLQKAIVCYEAALRVRTEKDFPVDWAMTQNNLGNIYRNLPTGDRGENLRKTIDCYEAAIRGYESTGLTKEAEGVKQLLASLKGELSS